MQAAVDVLSELGISCEMTVASRPPLARARDASGAGGARPRREGVHRRRRRCRAPRPASSPRTRRCPSSACRSIRRRSRGSTRCCRPCRCRPACRSRPCRSANRARPTPACSPRRSSRVGDTAIASRSSSDTSRSWRTKSNRRRALAGAVDFGGQRPRSEAERKSSLLARQHAFRPPCLGRRSVKYSIVTFGCRVNQADSLRIEEDLRARGGVATPPSDADLVIVNTCSVTASADQGARQTIRRIARDNPIARIVVTGCYATRCAARSRRAARTWSGGRAKRREETRPRPDDDRRSASAARRGSVRRRRSSRRCRPHGVHAARADRLRGALRLLHHSDRRAAPVAACRSTEVLREVERVSPRPASRKSRSPASISARTGAIWRRASRWSICCARSTAIDARRDVSHQLARADGLHAGSRRSSWPRARPVRAALPSAAAARERSHARRDAPAVHARLLPPARRRHRRRACRTRRSAPT